MKRIIWIILSSGFLLVSCKKESNINEDSEANAKNSELIEKLLNKQLKAGYGAERSETDFNNYTFEETDLTISNEILNDYLTKNGFISVENNVFTEKIKKVFNRTLDYNSDKTNVILNFSNPCNRDLIFNKNEGDELNDYCIYISKKQNFISELFSVPEILDYQKIYPESAKLESSLASESNEIKIYKWSDKQNLAKLREQNLKKILNRNKYLFNDNKQSFVWLQKNDKYFLESLVKTFGYVKDRQLLEFVFTNQKFINNPNVEDISPLLWHKTCDEKLVFHKETLDLINEKKNKTEYFIFLNDEYLRFIDKSELPISQKAEIIANILNFIALNSEENNPFSNMGFFAEIFDGGRKIEGKYSKEFIKHNFYNLKNFKKQWEDAKVDGDGVAYPGNIE